AENLSSRSALQSRPVGIGQSETHSGASQVAVLPKTGKGAGTCAITRLIRSFGKPAHVGSAGLRTPKRMSSPRPEPGLACRATDQACAITAIRANTARLSRPYRAIDR